MSSVCTRDAFISTALISQLVAHKSPVSRRRWTTSVGEPGRQTGLEKAKATRTRQSPVLTTLTGVGRGERRHGDVARRRDI